MLPELARVGASFFVVWDDDCQWHPGQPWPRFVARLVRDEGTGITVAERVLLPNGVFRESAGRMAGTPTRGRTSRS